MNFITGADALAADLSCANLSGATIQLKFGSHLKVTGANLTGAKAVIPDARKMKVEDLRPLREDFMSGLSEEQGQQISVVEEPAKKSGCFIATAACGSANEREVVALQEFRDSVLMNSRFGRHVVDCYNHLSPPLARQIESRPALKGLARILLVKPLAGCVIRFKNGNAR